ncbi:hypothetical protein BKA56DRAFT_234041 [Ilyonectria sp. MPI-CAGE-AT-0026]|nr:hypothetical protein BKA56DRAFT_234041 [Ilyonectria sp. MPI-CAGE-AT-0026]
MLHFGVHGQRQMLLSISRGFGSQHHEPCRRLPADPSRSRGHGVQVSSISFDISVLETFAAWTAGATLCIASEDDILTNLGRTLARLEATCVFATPTLLSMIEGGPSTVPGCVDYLHTGAREPGRLGHLARGYISPVSANAHYKSHPIFGRRYNTGDLALYMFDGELNFLGRADDQVKVNGVRLNLGDVERALQGGYDGRRS